MNYYHLYCGDNLKVLPLLKDESIDLVITSPPYNLQKEYEETLTLNEYFIFVNKVLLQCYKKLRIGGRICWNVPNQIRVGRTGKLWSPSIKTATLMEGCGFSFFDLIIWNQYYSDSATAWGSWKSPSAPFVRHQLEAILVFYKDKWKIQHSGETDLTKSEFMSLTKSELWNFSPESAKKIGHPAPFPEELPRRCMRLFSYIGDTILDPFVGSGTTIKVAQDLKRNCIGIEVNPKYCSLIKSRCFGRQFLDRKVEYKFEVVD